MDLVWIWFGGFDLVDLVWWLWFGLVDLVWWIWFGWMLFGKFGLVSVVLVDLAWWLA